MQPTLDSFWKGSDTTDRRVKYKDEYEARKDELEANAADTHRRICAVIAHYESRHGDRLPGRYSSGWRSRMVNDATKNSGKRSAHLDGNAGDVEDSKDGHFAWWCFRNQAVLAQHSLWIEHPVATVLMAKSTPWCHLSRVSPGSGIRCYFPTNDSVKVWNDYVANGGKPEGGPLAIQPKKEKEPDPKKEKEPDHGSLKE